MALLRGCHTLSRTPTTAHCCSWNLSSCCWNLSSIEEDHRALGEQMKSTGAQVIFSPILPVRGKEAGRYRQITNINSWLCGWCHCEGLGFYDKRTMFNDCNLLGNGGIHLSQKGKGICGSRLASSVKWALN